MVCTKSCKRRYLEISKLFQTPFATMYVKLTKKFITHNLMPYLSTTNLGHKPKVKLWKMVKAIIYRLKTGTQWRKLPLRQFFGFAIKSYKTVFYHYNKWTKDDSWHRLWTTLLKANKAALDMQLRLFCGRAAALKSKHVQRLILNLGQGCNQVLSRAQNLIMLHRLGPTALTF